MYGVFKLPIKHANRALMEESIESRCEWTGMVGSFRPHPLVLWNPHTQIELPIKIQLFLKFQTSMTCLHNTTNLGLYGPSGKFHNVILALWGTVRQILVSLQSSKQHSQCQLGSLCSKTYTTFLTPRPPIFHNNIQKPHDFSSCLFFTNNFYLIKYSRAWHNLKWAYSL